MKRAAIFVGAMCVAFTSVPASAALLVNWKTGQYREVSWEFCHIVGQNFADFQCFGGLSFTNEPLSDEQTKEAVQKFEGKPLPTEPKPAETQAQLATRPDVSPDKTQIDRNTSRYLKERAECDGTWHLDTGGGPYCDPFVAGPMPADGAPDDAPGKLKSNHNTTRSNRGAIAAPKGDDFASISDREKCVESGGTWGTNSGGSFCIR